MSQRAIALDIGSHTVKVLAVKLGKHGLSVTRFVALDADDAAELRGLGIPLKGSVVGVGGRDMILRYTQVPPSPDWQLRNLMELELQDLAAQSGGELSADYNLLPVQDEESGLDTVLMALARNEALVRVDGMVKDAGGSIEAHVPTCIAVYNAFLRCGPPVDDDQVVGIANIGRESTDFVLLRGSELLFARNLSGGGKVLDDTIATTFDVSERKAERLKTELLDLDPQSRGRYASSQAEKVSMAAMSASGMIVSGIQSSLAFCQSQTKIAGLRLDKLFLCGGTARTKGIRGMLREALHCPVELFDPFERCDLSELPAADAEQLQAMRMEAVPVLGLAAARVDRDLYQLEILPEAVKRRQRFVQRTVWNIAAAGVAVALLGGLLVSGRGELEESQRQADSVLRQAAAVKKVHGEAEELARSIARRHAVVQALAERAAARDGALAALRALADTMPPEMWVERLEVRKKTGTRSPTGVTAEPETVVVVKGKGKEVSGVPIGDVYRQFSTDFRQHPLIDGRVVPTSRAGATADVTEFTFEIDPERKS